MNSFLHGKNRDWLRGDVECITIALVCIAKNEDLTIREWFEYHKKIGFTSIYIYQNDWACQIEDEILHKKKIIGKHKQIEAYNNWISTKKNDYDFVCFIDCDEFIVLKKHANIRDFLLDYANPNGVAMNWVMFGSGGQTECGENRDSLLKRFLRRSSKVNQHIKSILATNNLHAMASPHHSTKFTYDTNWKKVQGPFNPNGPTDTIQLNHYYFKSLEEWKKRLERGQADHTTRRLGDWTASMSRDAEVNDTMARDWFYKKTIKLI